MTRAGRAVFGLLLSVVASPFLGHAADAGQRIKTTCQKRLSDNDIAVENGTVLPSSWVGFKLLHYTPKTTKDGFSHGPCVVTERR